MIKGDLRTQDIGGLPGGHGGACLGGVQRETKPQHSQAHGVSAAAAPTTAAHRLASESADGLSELACGESHTHQQQPQVCQMVVEKSM